MKKKVLSTVGALALGASAIVGGTLWAQGGGTPTTAPATPPAAHAPQVKLAFINLAYVLKNYKKVDALANEFKNGYKSFEDRAKPKQTEIERLTAENKAPAATPAKQEENLKTIKKLTREIEDINSEARTALAPKSEANTIGVYRDIQDAAARFAMANGFEMVLQFQDGFTADDYNSPMNIMNKMQTRACIPMYYQSSNDISLQVVNVLNDAYGKANPAAATGVAPASGTAPKGGN